MGQKHEGNNRSVNWTAIIAILTGGYFIATVVLVGTMIRSLNKMEYANILFRQSLDLQYRPSIYLDEISDRQAESPDTFALELRFKNSGVVAGKDVRNIIVVTEDRECRLTVSSQRYNVKAMCPPKGTFFIEEKVALNDLKKGLFAHIILNYTSVSTLPMSQRTYYVLVGSVKINIEAQKLKITHLYWDEKYMKHPLPETLSIHYKEDGIEVKISNE